MKVQTFISFCCSIFFRKTLFTDVRKNLELPNRLRKAPAVYLMWNNFYLSERLIIVPEISRVSNTIRKDRFGAEEWGKIWKYGDSGINSMDSTLLCQKIIWYDLFKGYFPYPREHSSVQLHSHHLRQRRKLCCSSEGGEETIRPFQRVLSLPKRTLFSPVTQSPPAAEKKLCCSSESWGGD